MVYIDIAGLDQCGLAKKNVMSFDGEVELCFNEYGFTTQQPTRTKIINQGSKYVLFQQGRRLLG